MNEKEILMYKFMEIIHQIENRYYVGPNKLFHISDDDFREIPKAVIPMYSAEELERKLKEKNEIIVKLHKLGAIDDKGFEDYFLSTDMDFIPKVKLD